MYTPAAMLFLAMLDEPVLNPVFSRTDAIGTVMRKKLKPVTGPIHEQIAALRTGVVDFGVAPSEPSSINHSFHAIANSVSPSQALPFFPSPIVLISKGQRSSTPLQHRLAIYQAEMRNSSGCIQQPDNLFDKETSENAYRPRWHLP